MIQVKDIKKKKIETLQKESHELIKNTLEKDPKRMALEAIEVWKNKNY